jgi:hypothetical protein
LVRSNSRSSKTCGAGIPFIGNVFMISPNFT